MLEIMRLYQYHLSARIYGTHKPELCYGRAKNKCLLYDDTASPRIEIARVFFGDTGWTFTGLVRARELDRFANYKQAMFVAFSQYTQSQNHDLQRNHKQ
jgi:hypothetical protein